jgi:ligand-binding SRPBCC domain-containing protein
MKTHCFHSSFRVKAALKDVADFHRLAENLAVLTPPPALVRLHSAPSPLDEGDQMDFTIWFGPFPVRWLAVIENSGPQGFTDRQIKGPYAYWAHTHNFETAGLEAGSTVIHDRVEYAFRLHLYYGLFGVAMALSLPLLFAYRKWKTRRLLEDGRH